ncbi:heme-binding protein [Halothiobacillus sp.]|uniref:GlcG/HbpS family heme-binding protein n=1 Tax=Halothiobacillus sp. TaxID=1891311 RepID=UPI002AD242B4|nr:heme-binding protein [Halothiobacillus sp.]
MRQDPRSRPGSSNNRFRSWLASRSRSNLIRYAVTAVVVDRNGDPQVMIRGTRANRFTIQIATDKARAVILSGVDSSLFLHNRGDIRMEMDHVDGILMLEGGVRIDSVGTLVGALGVSGAPGGEKDEPCAKTAVAAYVDQLDMP